MGVSGSAAVGHKEPLLVTKYLLSKQHTAHRQSRGHAPSAAPATSCPALILWPIAVHAAVAFFSACSMNHT
jgi:hypothetical protein